MNKSPKINQDDLTRKIIKSVSECVSTNKGKTLELIDGSIVRLTPLQAKRFIEVHDELSESSQASFRMMLIETKKSFEGVAAFCKERN
jgi:hypothetical protein